jgi:hypothetical protein
MATYNSDTVTLRLLPGTPSWTLPVIAGHWGRDDGAIVARYDRGDGDGTGDELAVALWVWRAVYRERNANDLRR